MTIGDSIDGAITQFDDLGSDYVTYLDGFNDLNGHAGSYQKDGHG